MRGSSTLRALLLGIAGFLPAVTSANGGDTCSAPTAIASLPYSDDGTTGGASHDGFALPAGCSTYATVAGPDVIYSLTVGAGNSVSFQVVPEASYDVAIYLLGHCDDHDTCVDGQDAGLAGSPEQFTRNNLPAGDYFFYVDSFYSSGSMANPSRHQGAFTLTVTGSLGALPTTTTSTSTSSSTSTTVATTTTTSTLPTSTTSTTAVSSTTSTTLVVSSTTTSLLPATSSTTVTSSTTSSTTFPSSTSTSATTSTSSTTSTTRPPLCSDGVAIVAGAVRLTKLGDPAGNEGMLVRGTLDFPAGTPATFDPATRGTQLRIEDVGDGAMLLDLTSATAPIPPGAPGTGCGLRDGWTRTTYRNASNAVGAPACPVGSAHGLRILKVKDERSKGGGITLKGVVRGTALGTPTGPLRVTFVLGADPAAGAAGECGVVSFAAGACAQKKRTYACR